MRALDRKLLRDLAAARVQVVSIALVVACGIAALVACLSTYISLMDSRDLYYEAARFPHVFASAKRAPASLLARIRAIPGVAEAQARVVRDAQLSVDGVAPPMIARLVGTDFARPPGMNQLTLASGRWPSPGARGEAVVNRRFLEARSLALGQVVRVLVNGRQESLEIVGTALAPEYVYATRGGGMPDDEWFAVLWVDAARLAAASGLEGAFDSVLLRLERGAVVPGVVAALDALLEPYGGLGAVGREDQMSDRILRQEIGQQRVFGIVMPTVFLAVAAFILNVVLHRHVSAQRAEIAALKALGYPDRRIVAHYLAFAAVIVALGIVLGVALGAWLGLLMTRLYTSFFHFPSLHYAVPPWVAATGSLAAVAAGLGGAFAAVRGILTLRAAEALRPPAPERFRPLLLERAGLAAPLTTSQRMVMRNLERHAGRAAVTVGGVAAAAAILISGTFWSDAVESFMQVQFGRAFRADVQVGFAEPLASAVRHELGRLPGVREVELMRAAPVRLRAGHRAYRTAITGIPRQARLVRILDEGVREVATAPGELVLTDRLAERLGVAAGDEVEAELLEGERRRVVLRVARLASELAGMNAWMDLDDLNRLARDGDLASVAHLRVDRDAEAGLLAALKGLPGAAVVIVNRTLVETFRATSARNLLFFTTILTAFAAVIAVGVVYNNARIQLAERSWELASLRVLGFTRGEVSTMLLGELGVELALAVPARNALGHALAALMLALMPHEVMRIPLVILPATDLYAVATLAGAGVASALVVRRRIDRLDLVAALKTRE